MELWKDQQREKWFALDTREGKHFECDMYGQAVRRFRIYDTGHASPRDRSPNYHPASPPRDLLYVPQPREAYSGKFQGYSQCPRPMSLGTSRPGTNSSYQRRTGSLRPRRAKTISEVLKPTSFLSLSAVDDSSIHSPRPRSPLPTVSPQTVPSSITIEGLKASLIPKPYSLVRTPQDYSAQMAKEEAQRAGFQPPPPKPIRRKLKGMFQLRYPTVTEVYKRDVALWKITNPVVFEQQKRYEEMDLKALEKRREQRVLKSKLVQKEMSRRESTIKAE